uniref:Uncharacterized protein n=1 Tax=Panagrolaimus sp. PS1159 TaxID=55785 RepID=A0AC35EWV9_9BILA
MADRDDLPMSPNRKRKAKDDTTMVESKRSKFLSTYISRQTFALPDSMMFYIKKNRSASLYKKLIKSCKYFFIKQPLLIVNSLFYYYTEWLVENKTFDLSKCTLKLWILDELDVSPDCRNAGHDELAVSVMSKLHRCDAKELSLSFQVISFNDLSSLISSAEFVSLQNVTVINGDGTTTAIEKIVEIAAKATSFFFKCTPVLDTITSKTFDQIVNLPNFPQVTQFSLENIPEVFDLEAFYVFMKKNKTTKFHLKFADSCSEAYKNRIEAIIDEYLGTFPLDYEPVVLHFPQLNWIKRSRLCDPMDDHTVVSSASSDLPAVSRVKELCYVIDHWLVDDHMIDMSKHAKVWITDELDIRPDLTAAGFYMAHSLIPKLYRCDAKILTLYHQVLALDDLALLISSAEDIDFLNVTIKNNNGTHVALEKLVEIAVKAKKIQIKSDTTFLKSKSKSISAKTFDQLVKIPHFKQIEVFDLENIPEVFDLEAFYVFMKSDNVLKSISSITFDKLLMLPHFKQIEEFDLENIPESFDLEDFYVFMKENNTTKYWFYFDDSISPAYKKRIESIVDEILSTKVLNYKAPVVNFRGLDRDKYEKLVRLTWGGNTNNTTQFVFHFDDSISPAYKKRIEAIVDEVLSTKNLNYKAPAFDFRGFNQDKYEKLARLQKFVLSCDLPDAFHNCLKNLTSIKEVSLEYYSDITNTFNFLPQCESLEMEFDFENAFAEKPNTVFPSVKNLKISGSCGEDVDITPETMTLFFSFISKKISQS